MAGFQFVHVETYSRKADKGGRTVSNVLDEAERQPDACTHVEAPGVPEIVFGVGVSEIRNLHDQRAAKARSEVAGSKSRKARVDQHTLLTVIASHPADMSRVRLDPVVAGEVAAWEDRTVAWLRETWGDRLVGVVRHADESHPHLHAYVLPDDAGMKAKGLHPGAVAKAAAKETAEAEGCDGKTANARGDAAYRSAMRSMQDAYWEKAGLPSGLARLGPGRRRLDRGAWKAEQAVVGATAHALQIAGVARGEAAAATATRGEAEARAVALAERGAAYVAAARAEAAKAMADADAARRAEADARAAAARLVRGARREAAATVAAAEARVGAARRVGAVLGALWSGFAGVQRRIEVAADRRVAVVQSAARAAVVGAREVAVSSVGVDLVAVTRRAESAEAALAAALAATQRAEAEAVKERGARVSAESECERFRGLWSAVDNVRLAYEQGRAPR